MAKLDALRKIEGLRKRIDQYKRGEEVNPRDLRPLLSDAQWEQMDLELQRQQQLKKQRRPERLAAYEEQHRQCAALMAKCRSVGLATEKQRKAAIVLQIKCEEAVLRAYETALKFREDGQAQRWMDRAYGEPMWRRIYRDLDGGGCEENLTTLEAMYAELPILVSSASADKRCTQAERFGWMTISEVRCSALEKALVELDQGIEAALEQEMYRKEVRSAKIFMDAYSRRIRELTGGIGSPDAVQEASAWSMANRALQQAGFRPVFGIDRSETARDREVREMEEALLARFEAEMTEEEREQLEMAREMDREAERRRKGKR
jgi:hypothetical protein